MTMLPEKAESTYVASVPHAFSHPGSSEHSTVIAAKDTLLV